MVDFALPFQPISPRERDAFRRGRAGWVTRSAGDDVGRLELSVARSTIYAMFPRQNIIPFALRSALVGLAWLAGSAATAAAPAHDAEHRPNVVFILADDLGWTDTGTYGSQYYETPHIDRLAEQGIKLTQHHSCPNCQPTRAALMTGKYGARTGVYTVGDIDRFDWRTRPLRPVDNVERLPLDHVTIAQQLKGSGYATALFGKWHLGEHGAYHPSQRGFDEAITTQKKHYHFATQPVVDYPPGAYLADWLTDQAVDFIQRKKDEPFFLYLPHFGVHAPLDAKPELIARFQEKQAVGGHRNPVYAAMIASVDESVGRVVEALREAGVADNTLVLFSSDNGGVGGYQREGLHEASDTTDNAPLRSGKGSLYEGGVRVPLIAMWPGVAPPGGVCDEPTIHVDLFPTLLEATQTKAPADARLDGESLVALFRDPRARLEREAIFQHFPGYLGAGEGQWRTTPVGTIQLGPWKLLEFFEDGRLELYNLGDDVGETKNLAEQLPAKVRELRERLDAWRRSVGAPMPTAIRG